MPPCHQLHGISKLTHQEEPPENNLAQQVAELIKRSKYHQFYGLMGRRSGAPQTVPMGYKKLSEEWDRPQYYARRRK
ncbi:hypothetical protein EOD39_4072 [Acipenser ruthenus]|uniref:Uncharacterized protein n=1 Tax=Acipenser ruthenus TaxID=7906 RepID=A0A444UK19_ACIRT|nr:hypothetical protein EOD39_4072 [Acipenser ruthenus]